MAVARYTIKLTNDNVDPSNYALVGFSLDSSGPGGSPAVAAAQLLTYMATAGFQLMGGAVRITEVNYRAAGSPGGVLLPWPTAEVNAVVAAAVADSFPVADPGDNYGTNIAAAGALCPLGTSASISELTAQPGRAGRGRHFMPYMGTTPITPGGRLSGPIGTAVAEAYNYFLRGKKPSGGAAPSAIVNLVPVVTNGLGTTLYPVTAVKAQDTLSNLKSRRR